MEFSCTSFIDMQILYVPVKNEDKEKSGEGGLQARQARWRHRLIIQQGTTLWSGIGVVHNDELVLLKY